MGLHRDRTPVDTALLAQLVDDGCTVAEIADRLHVSYPVAYYNLRRLQYAKPAKAPKGPRAAKTPRPAAAPRVDPNAARNEKMVGMYRQGLTLEKIGQTFDITRERVRQILTRVGVTAEHGGIRKQAQAKKQAKVAQRDARSLARWGMTYEQAEVLRRSRAIHSFKNQKYSAKSRGIDWSLTLAQWWDIWQTSGKWEMRGRGKGKYVMSRIKDTGGYAVGNVHIQLGEENASEGLQKHARKNKVNRGVWCLYPGLSKPWIAKYSRTEIGRYATEEEAVAARQQYMAEHGLTPGTTLGSGRGWTFDSRNKSRPYQVQVAGAKSVRCATQEEAEAVYRALVAEVIELRKVA
jgi:DNA-binding CsgD family transcriptional regulator